MQSLSKEEKLLAQDCAAFLVKHHKITHVNTSAQECNIRIGDDVRELLCIGSREYEEFRSGILYLELLINGTRQAASVSAERGYHLFCLIPVYDNEELKAMALAGQQLLQPLQDSLHQTRLLQYCVSNLKNADIEMLNTAGLTRSLYQLMRDITNMIDASKFSDQRVRQFRYENLSKFFDGMGNRLNQLSSKLNRRFEYTGLDNPVYTMLDRQALERAFYNLISNAVKFSPEGSLITVKLTTADKRILVTVSNSYKSDHVPISQYFKRYLRIPIPEQDCNGIGLGTTVIRTIATAHGGTIFINKEDNDRISITMTVGILANKENTLHNRDFQLIYSGGFDTALVELSEVLPISMYG